MHFIGEWFRRTFNDPQVVGLTLVLTIGLGVVVFLGDMLAPVFAAIVVAYLLEGVVASLERWALPRVVAVTLVFVFFFTLTLFVIFAVMPVLSNEAALLFQRDLPLLLERLQGDLIDAVRATLRRLPPLLTDLPTESASRELMEIPGTGGQVWVPVGEFEALVRARVDQLSDLLRAEVKVLGQKLLTVSLDSLFGLVTFAVYLVLVPVMVFFFLKDKAKIMLWLKGFLPHNRSLATQVWHDVDAKIGNYIRGKFAEIVLVWAATYITFSILGVKFSLLLAFMVGISVLVPYVGAVAVTVPVAMVAYLQPAGASGFYAIMVAYLIIQVIDGNVLVPLLFSEVVNLHPVAIIVAILVFGGIWGFWGVFFAIPLATLVQAVIQVWPRKGNVAMPDNPANSGLSDGYPAPEQA